MATALKNVTRKARTVYDDVTEINLTLSQAEADTLYALTNAVGGPSNGPRGKVRAIREALYSAGARNDSSIRTHNGNGIAPGALYIDDAKNVKSDPYAELFGAAVKPKDYFLR
jgi:hypothetical protein